MHVLGWFETEISFKDAKISLIQIIWDESATNL